MSENTTPRPLERRVGLVGKGIVLGLHRFYLTINKPKFFPKLIKSAQSIILAFLRLYWSFNLFQGFDAITRADILSLQESNFILKLRVFRLQCANILLELRIFIQEVDVGFRKFPFYQLRYPDD